MILQSSVEPSTKPDLPRVRTSCEAAKYVAGVARLLRPGAPFLLEAGRKLIDEGPRKSQCGDKHIDILILEYIYNLCDMNIHIYI